MKNYKTHLLLCQLFIVSIALSQNFAWDARKKIYIYRTQDDFFKGRKDSIPSSDIDYNYGKISYKDKNGKKVKYNLLKDSAFFAFRIGEMPDDPIYAFCQGEKRYGVYFGGSENLFMLLYINGMTRLVYDKNLYPSYYIATYYDFEYYCRFVKKGFDDKEKFSTVDSFIKDDQQLYNTYLAEYKATKREVWARVFLDIQLKYLKKYNKVIK